MATRKVTYARLYENVHVNGLVGDLGNVFPSQSKTLEGLEMVTNEYGILDIKFRFRGENVELRLKDGIKVMRLAPEEQSHEVHKVAAKK